MLQSTQPATSKVEVLGSTSNESRSLNCTE